MWPTCWEPWQTSNWTFQTRAIYILGPPVKTNLVQDIVRFCLKSFFDNQIWFQDVIMKARLLFKVSWVMPGRHREQENRPGMQGMWIYAFTVSCWVPSISGFSFALLVIDEVYGSKKDSRGTIIPKFETFAVIDVTYGNVQPGKVFEWYTTHDEWSSRHKWIESRSEADDNKDRRHYMQELCKPVWIKLWDLQALFPCHPPNKPCEGKKGDVNVRMKMVRFDTVFPLGLPLFLARSAERPTNFEALCCELFNFETRWQRNKENIRPPIWMQSIGQARHAIEADCLRHWLWGAMIAIASNAVKRLFDTHAHESNVIYQVDLVAGVSRPFAKQIGLDSFSGTPFKNLFQLCCEHKMKFRRVSLTSRGQWTFFRGVKCFTPFESYMKHDVDTDAWGYSSMKDRLVLLQWYLSDQPVRNEDHTCVTTLHYIDQVDPTTGQLRFTSPIAVRHPKNTSVNVLATFGPWLNHGEETFKDIVYRSDNFIKTLEHFFCFRSFVSQCIPPRKITAGGHLPEQKEKLFLCVGGPGTGKTTEQLLGEMKYAAENGLLAFMTSNLNELRNMHLALFKDRFPPAIFKRRVRVQGHLKLSKLAESRTLNSLTWNLMESDVRDDESKVMDLWRWCDIEVKNFFFLINFAKAKYGLSYDFAVQIDKILGISDGMHNQHIQVAERRILREEKVKDVRKTVMQETTLVVGTQDALVGSEHLNELNRAFREEKIAIIACDEPTRSSHVHILMFIASLQRWIDTKTKLAFVGDPTQLGMDMKLLPATETILAGTTCSTMEWLMNQILDSGATPEDLEARINFLNRTTNSKRLREAAAALVTELAPACLPGKKDFWMKKVHGQALWADLQPRVSQSSIDTYMDSGLSEIYVYHLMQTMDSATDPKNEISGYVGSSKYNLNVALSAAAAALCLAILELRLRRDTKGLCKEHFSSIEEMENWRNKKVKVQILAPYKGMLHFTKRAVDFLFGIPKETETAGQPISNLIDIIVVDHTSVDASQGNTYQISVLASPGDNEWTKFSADKLRVLTMCSRHYLTIALPQIGNYGRNEGPKTSKLPTESISALSTMQKEAKTTWKWKNFRDILGIRMSEQDLWKKWMDDCDPFIATLRKTTDSKTIAPCIRPSLSIKQTQFSPVQFRGCDLTFLRSIQRLYRCIYEKEPPMQTMLMEVQMIQKQKTSQSRILGQQPCAADKSWFFGDFLNDVMKEFQKWSQSTGAVRNVLYRNIQTTDDSSRLYSVWVDGLGEKQWNEWAMTRVEWLCLEITFNLLQICSAARAVEEIKEKMQVQDEPLLTIAWAAHKVRFDGFQMSSTGAGANDRADFFLLAQDALQAELPKVIATFYHTTNVPELTTTEDPHMIYPESRILCECPKYMNDFVDAAVWECAKRVRKDQGLHWPYGDRPTDADTETTEIPSDSADELKGSI